MSYHVLARKWRPQRFSELVGQEHVVRALSNALERQRLHHAYLFTGTRGVGKTTIARIFAKSLNCERGEGASPCGKCDTCVDIEGGRYVDLLEIDAASRTKVEDTRELLDNVQYAPTRGRYKVYLIDEVHMLSKHSFNALLKTLEEPPPHVKFLLATTDPQKLPITVLSRCLQFNLKALSRSQIVEKLSSILLAEGFSFEPEALELLAKAAQGSMRDALSLTDQAIAQGDGALLTETVQAMLGILDKDYVLQLLRALIEGNKASVFGALERVVEQSADFEQFLVELCSYLHQIALVQMVPDVCKIETNAAKTIFELSKQVSPEHVQLLYDIGLKGRKDIIYAPDRKVGLEMTLIRMLCFVPSIPSLNVIPEVINSGLSDDDQDVSELQHEQSNIEEQATRLRQSAPTTRDHTSASSPTDALIALRQQLTKGKSEAPIPVKKSEESSEPSPLTPETPRHQTASEEEKGAHAAPTQAFEVEVLSPYLPDGSKLTEASQICGWSKDVANMGLHGLVKQVVLQSLATWRDSSVVLTVDRSQQHLINENVTAQLKSAFEHYYKRPLSLAIEIDSPQNTPYLIQQRINDMRMNHAKAVAQNDSDITALVRALDARIIDESIQAR